MTTSLPRLRSRRLYKRGRGSIFSSDLRAPLCSPRYLLADVILAEARIQTTAQLRPTVRRNHRRRGRRRRWILAFARMTSRARLVLFSG
jgi:hypothetical protein